MKAERIILSFVAVLVGLVVASGAYFVYEHYMKSGPQQPSKTLTLKVTPTAVPQNPADYLSIDSLSDETVSSDRSVTINGKATKNSTVVISTLSMDQVAVASADGSFTATMTLDDGTNPLYITAIFPDGTEQRTLKTITYSTASF